MRAYSTLIRGLVLVLLGVLGWAGMGAQGMVTATSREISGPPNPKSFLREKAECLDDPGMILSYDNINVSSNSFDNAAKGSSLPYDPDRETIFLCAGDNFVINLQDEPPVNDDPLPKSPSGVAYVAYLCPPSAANVGPSRDVIENDPCILKFDGENATFFSPIDYFGRNFDLQVGNTYDPTPPGVPQSYSYAPVTVDAYDIGDPDNPDDNAFLFDFVTDDGTASGDIVVPQCNNVAIDQLVSVTLLDEVRLEDLNENPGGCSGSFRVRGGISEFRGTAEYDITLRKEGSSESIPLDQPVSSIKAGDLVTYSVPEDGTYEIVLEDGVSCDGFATVEHTACAVAEEVECTADAGEIENFINVRMEQSNSLGDVPLGGTAAYPGPNDTVFLCLGDEFTINLLEDSWNLDFDPKESTQNGIAYAIYDRVPTVSGPGEFGLFDADPANFDSPTPPFDGSVTYTPPTDFEGGDYSLRVEHVEPPFTTDIFADANGNPQPKVIAIAPITVSGRNSDGDALIEEYLDDDGNLVEDCIAVSTDQTVQVGFLNPIDANFPSGACDGNFIVTGGKSELVRSSNYTISITDATGAAVDALENGMTGYGHGDVVNYSFDAEGTYNVSVTDEVSCGFTGQIVVTEVCAEEEEEEPEEPTADLDFSVVPQPVSCTRDNDGALVVTISGGIGPYTIRYQRTNPRTDAVTVNVDNAGDFTITDLLTGFYEVSVSDDTGATTDIKRDIRIEEGSPFSIDIVTSAGPDCEDGDEITLTVSVIENGDTIQNPTNNGYTVAWSSGESTETIPASPNEVYEVTVTDVSSTCPKEASITAERPNTLLIEVTQSPTTDATCSDSQDGSVTVQVSGGVPGADGYNFAWSDGVNQQGETAKRASLNPGSYTVTVTDDNECSEDTRTFTVLAEKTLVPLLDSTQVECFGESNGTISVRASTEGAGASLPYRASVEDAAGTRVAPFQTLAGNGSTPLTFEGFAAGTYIVVLQDSDPQQCETRDTITVTEPVELSLTVETYSPICPEDPEGTATLIVTGGTGPYTFRVINDSLPDLVDSLMTFDTLLVDTNFLDTLRPSPFYIAIIDDANGCGPDSLQFEIKPRPQPRVTNALFTTISCPGDSDGQLSAIVSPPPGDSITITDYGWFRLNDDNSKGEQVSMGRTTDANLTVGAYLLEVTLSNDCVWPFPGFVDSPGLVSLDTVVITDPTCLGDTDGSIELSAIGGTPNADGTYNYTWLDLDTPITDPTRTGLSADTYSVTITDANNCQPAFETSFVLEEPVGIVGKLTPEDVSCPSDTSSDGRATIIASLSDGSDTGQGFDFIWSRGATDTIRGGTTTSLSSLARGPISVTVTDGVCPQVFDTIIGSPEEFAFEEIITPATCNGDSTGAAEILVTGGTPGYTFSYVDRPEVTNRLEDVGAGLYQLLVTDTNGCQADTFSFVINQPDALVLAIDPFVTTPRVTCFGDEDGVLAVQVVSTNNNPLGDSPYSWSPAVAGSSESSATGLAPGDYAVTVTDEAGCQDSLRYTIFEPDVIQFAVDTIADPLCFNDPAEITLDTAFGGQGNDLLDYNFTINNDGFLTPFDQVGLGFGDSVVISVFDSVGCFSEQTFQIQQPDEIVIDQPNRLLVELGDSLTQLNPLISPGGRDYRYRWTAPRFEPPVPFLSNDSIRDPFLLTPTQSVEYTLTVTDENGCQAIDDIFVEIDANRNVFIPNVFSPNMDGRNDDFRIYACTGVVGITKVNIFNRWGGLLFERENIPSSCLDGTLLWDGRTPEGREVDPGVYVYTIEVLFIDGVTLLYRGDIAVVR